MTRNLCWQLSDITDEFLHELWVIIIPPGPSGDEANISVHGPRWFFAGASACVSSRIKAGSSVYFAGEQRLVKLHTFVVTYPEYAIIIE